MGQTITKAISSHYRSFVRRFRRLHHRSYYGNWSLTLFLDHVHGHRKYGVSNRDDLACEFARPTSLSTCFRYRCGVSCWLREPHIQSVHLPRYVTRNLTISLPQTERFTNREVCASHEIAPQLDGRVRCTRHAHSHGYSLGSYGREQET